MKNFANAKISVRQFTILIILGVVGDSILVLPTVAASLAKQDAWLSMLLAALLGIAIAGLFAAIAGKLRGEGVISACRSRLGLIAGSLAGLLFLFYFFIVSLSLLSEMSEFMTTQLMPETPVNAIITLFLAVVIIAYRYGVEAFARMGELLFPVFMALFAFLAVFLLPQTEVSNLQPIMGDGAGPVLRGTLPAFAFGFAEMVVLLMLVPHVEGGKTLTKPILTGFAAGGAILFVIMLLSVLVLGPNMMETKYYPTFVLAQKITIGHFLERLEAILAFLWIITVFFKTLFLFFGLTTGISQLLGLKESKMLTIPISMILLVCTIVSAPNIAVYNEILIKYAPWFDLTFCMALPVLFLFVLYLPARRGRAKAGKQAGNGGE